MAITRERKEQIVTELEDKFNTSKMTIAAKYSGTTVGQMQNLRHLARDDQTDIKVVKNRLVKLAISKVDKLKNTETDELKGQLLYAFNPVDEVAPAQNLAKFNKRHKTLEFVGGITDKGEFLSAEEVKSLSELPDKQQLRAQLVGTINAPLGGLINVLNANLRGVLNVLNARADSIK